MGIYNLAKKAHGITNGANAVHSEKMGIYNLAKKGHHITNDANAVHSERLGIYNLAKKYMTLLMMYKCSAQ